MADNNYSLINLEGLPTAIADLGKALLDKISSAIGWCFEPKQVKRLAEANAQAKLIAERGAHELEILRLNHSNKLLESLPERLIQEAIKKDQNSLSIINKSFEYLNNSALPQNIDNDWLISFYEKSKLISNEEMQEHWARILAGEANQAQSFSKRTLSFMSDLERKDAEAFTKLCSFKFELNDCDKDTGIFILLPHEFEKIEIFSNLNYDLLLHLESIGLIHLNTGGRYSLIPSYKEIQLRYRDSLYDLSFQQDRIVLGLILLTTTGKELSKICNPKPIHGFEEYLIKELKKQSCSISKVHLT